MWIARTQGRSVVGQRAVRVTNNQKGQQLMLTLFVHKVWGLIYHTIHFGSITKEIYQYTLSEINEVLGNTAYDTILLMDNARVHNDCNNFNFDVKY